MIALILAAGYGNRMRPLTKSRHKTLLTVAGREILGRIVDGVVANGIRRFVVVTGYRHEEVQDFLVRQYSAIEFQFVHNPRYHETNNIYSMALAFEAMSIDEDVMLIESDLVCEPAIFARVINSPHRNVALVDRYRTGMDGTVVEIDSGVITNVVPPHQQGRNFIFTNKFKTLNIYKFDRDFCESTFKKLLVYYARAIDSNCYYELVLGMLIYMQRDVIHAEIVDGLRWTEVDDPNDLGVAEVMFNDAERYDIVDACFGGFWNFDVLDFGFIRNMYFPTPSMFSEIRNSLESLLHSYSSTHAVLRRKLGYLLLCDVAALNVLDGASQVFPTLGRFCETRRVWVPTPTFGEYRRIFKETVEYRDDAEWIPQIERGLADGDAVVFVNPNNPTGRFIESAEIVAFAKRQPGCTVIVDESFIEFAPGRSVQQLLQETRLENVIVIKSLSKSMGIPGLRLGYTYSYCDRFNRQMDGDVPIWHLNSVAEFMLETCLKHRQALADSIVKTCRDREQFSGDLRALKIVTRVVPSGANFVLVELNIDRTATDRLARKLMDEQRIYVKNASTKFMDGRSYFRLAVRFPHENRRLCQAIAKLTSSEVSE